MYAYQPITEDDDIRRCHYFDVFAEGLSFIVWRRGVNSKNFWLGDDWRYEDLVLFFGYSSQFIIQVSPQIESCNG